ncbi:MAG: lipid asymmetry maintenance protein MlaB [Kingella oralis]|nr:STAS domain-containing protein [uncultured Kingella sp.]
MQSEIRDNIVYVQGEVSVQTVDKTTLAQFAQQCGQPEVHAIDCSQITRADSACLSLLLTALRQREQGSLKIHNLPPSVRDLAQLYEIEEWITA